MNTFCFEALKHAPDDVENVFILIAVGGARPALEAFPSQQVGGTALWPRGRHAGAGAA